MASCRLSLELGLFVFGGAAGALASGCLSQSYEVSAPELARLVALPTQERGDHVRVVQQTAFANDLHDIALPNGDADVALLIASHDRLHSPGERGWEDDWELDDESDGAAEQALAAAVVVVATAATAALTVGITEGARFDGWMRAPEQHPVLLVDRWGGRRWQRLGALGTSDLRDVDHAVLADFSDDLERIERHPLDREGFVYQLEFGAEPAPFEGPELAVSGRGGIGFMPAQQYGFLLGAAFASARADTRAVAPSDTALSFDSRVFLQAEAWPLSAGRFHVGPYAELGYAWALADDAIGSRGASGPMLALGVALQLDWMTRLALTLRAGAAWLPDAGNEQALAAAGGYRLGPSLTLGVGIY